MWFFGGSTTMVHYELTMNHICSITNHIFSTFLTFMNRYGPRVWHLLAIYVQLQTTVNHYYPLENRWKSRFSTKNPWLSWLTIHYPLTLLLALLSTTPCAPCASGSVTRVASLDLKKGPTARPWGRSDLYTEIYLFNVFLYIYTLCDLLYN